MSSASHRIGLVWFVVGSLVACSPLEGTRSPEEAASEQPVAEEAPAQTPGGEGETEEEGEAASETQPGLPTEPDVGAACGTPGASACPPVTHVLSVTRSGTSGPGGKGRVVSTPAGIDCGLSCFAAFPEGESVTLTAMTLPGTVFAGWTGACSGTGSCVVTLTRGQAVEARFETLSGTEIWSQLYSAEALWAGNYAGLPAFGERIAADATGNLVVAGQAGWFGAGSIVMTPGFSRVDGMTGAVLSSSRVAELQFPAPVSISALTVDGAGQVHVGVGPQPGSAAAAGVERFTPAGASAALLRDQRQVTLTSTGELVTASSSDVSRWSTAGLNLWTVSLPDLTVVALRTDALGGLFVLGEPRSPQTGALHRVAQVVRLRLVDGVEEWRTTLAGQRLGTVVDLHARALDVTPSGEVYVAGHTVGPNGFRGALVKLDSSGVEQWFEELDFLQSQAQLLGVAVTPGGGAVVTGWVQRLVPVEGQPHPTQLVLVAAFGGQGGTPTWELETHPSALSSGMDVTVRGSHLWVTGIHGVATPASQLLIAKYQL